MLTKSNRIHFSPREQKTTLESERKEKQSKTMQDSSWIFTGKKWEHMILYERWCFVE